MLLHATKHRRSKSKLKNVAEDIKAYVNDHVENLVKAKKLRLGKPTLKGKIVELLVARAEGM